LFNKVYGVNIIIESNNKKYTPFDYTCPLTDRTSFSANNVEEIIRNILLELNYSDLISGLNFYILSVNKVNYTYSVSFTIAINGTPVWLVYDRIFINPCLNITEVDLSPRIYYLVKTKHYVEQRIGLNEVEKLVLDKYRELYEDKYGSIKKYVIKIGSFTITSNISSEIVYTPIDLNEDGIWDLLIPICNVRFSVLTSNNIELNCVVIADLYSGDCKFNCNELGG